MPKEKQPPPPGFESGGTWPFMPSVDEERIDELEKQLEPLTEDQLDDMGKILGEEQLHELSEVLGIKEIPSRYSDEIQEAVRRYIDKIDEIVDRPLSAKDHVAVDRLKHFAECLVKTLNNLGSRATDRLINAYIAKPSDLAPLEEGQSSNIHPTCIIDTLDQCEKSARRVACVAEYALSKWPRGQGDRFSKRGGLQRLILKLADVYTHIKGTPPTKTWNPYSEKFEGDFFNFVAMVLHFVDDEDISNTTLGGQIRDTLKGFKKKPPP